MTTTLFHGPKLLHAPRRKGLARLRPHGRKATIGFGASVAGALVLAGVAVVYLVPSTGNSSVTIGGSTFTVTVGVATGPALLPGTGTETMPVTITNPTSKTETLSTLTAALANDGSGNTLDASNSDTPTVGCLTSWFTVTVNNPSGPSMPFPVYVGSPYSDSGNLTVTVSESDPSVSQNACLGTDPEVIVSAS